MIVACIFIFLFILIFGAGVLYAFGWSARSGQFHRIDEGARSIFNEDEPVGKPTDAFPGESPAAQNDHSAGPDSTGKGE